MTAMKHCRLCGVTLQNWLSWLLRMKAAAKPARGIYSDLCVRCAPPILAFSPNSLPRRIPHPENSCSGALCNLCENFKPVTAHEVQPLSEEEVATAAHRIQSFRDKVAGS
jgi:hypothetical protein